MRSLGRIRATSVRRLYSVSLGIRKNIRGKNHKRDENLNGLRTVVRALERLLGIKVKIEDFKGNFDEDTFHNWVDNVKHFFSRKIYLRIRR